MITTTLKQKTLFKIVPFFFALVILVLPLKAKAENIDDMAAKIWWNTDGSFKVEETIHYDFGPESKHGIYRYIPYRYKQDGENYKIEISDISVKDQNGSKYNYTTSHSGNDLVLKIGDAASYVSGQQTYVIGYKVAGATLSKKDVDELYWNVTGNGWQIDANQAEVTVYLPQGSSADKVKAIGYYGPAGSPDTVMATVRNGEVAVVAPRLLKAGEGLTVAVDLPKGIIAGPTKTQKMRSLILTLWPVVIPIIAFIVLFRLWQKNGRDPKGRGTVIPEYDAPDGLTPLEVGTIVDNDTDNRDFAAEILYFATKGYLKITRIKEEGIVGFLSGVDYEFQKLADENELPKEFDRAFMARLFKNGNTVRMSELKDNFYIDIQAIREKAARALINSGYFKNDPKKTQGTYVGIGIAMITAGFIIVVFYLRLSLALIASGALTMVFSFFAGAKTQQGAFAKEHILGFKQYLSVAEKLRLEFHNAPEKNPQTFERFLPYAVALGVESQWAFQFEGIVTQSPSWYVGSDYQVFSAMAFTHDITDFSVATGSNLATAPNSNSGGVGGGGGFSGGFGGGGGGSW